MKIWKRAAAMVLAGAMSLSLFGCGDKKEETQVKTLAQELGYGYVSEYSDLDVNFDWLRSATTAQGKLYVCGDYYNDETYESGVKFYEIDLASNQTREIPMPEMVQEENTNENLQSISVCPDGSGYWMVTETYTYVPYEGDISAEPMPAEAVPYDEAAPEEAVPEEAPVEEPVPEELPEDVAEEPGLAGEYSVELLSDAVVLPAEAEESTVEDASADVGVMPIDEPADYTPPEEQYTAKKCDMSGNVLLEIDLTEATQEQDWFYCQSLTQDAQGNLFIASDQVILCYGSDGSRKADITLNDIYIQSMVSTGNGAVMVSYYDPEASKMVLAPLEEGKIGTALEVTGANDQGGSYFSGDGDTMLMSDGTLLYSVDVTTGQATKLLSWLDSDINGNNISGIAANGSDKILVLRQEWHREGRPTLELGTLTKTPVEELPKRTYLTLGAVWLDSDIQEAVIDFNRKSDTYRITLVDYQQYNTDEDYTLGAQQLDMDVVSGNCPDLVDLSSGHPDKYISKGVLTDLGALIDKDDSFSLDQFMSGPMKAYQKDGKLYGIPTGFSYETMYGSAKLLGDRSTWTLAEMAQIIQSLPEDVDVMQNWSQINFLSNMVQENLGRFVDYGSASCSFDSEEFKSILAAAATLPSQEEMEAYWNSQNDDGGYMYVDDYQRLQSGEQLITTGTVFDYYDVKNLFGLYTKDNGIVNIGYPTDSGNGGHISVSGGIGISDKCAHKDGAWAFVKTLLDDEFQQDQGNLPMSVSAFDARMEQAMKPETYTDENGQEVEYESTGWIGDTEYPMNPVTQAQVDQFKDMVNGAEIAGRYDQDIYDIIDEEAAAYFAGDKSADEAAKLIQNRVSIYLGETS